MPWPTNWKRTWLRTARGAGADAQAPTAPTIGRGNVYMRPLISFISPDNGPGTFTVPNFGTHFSRRMTAILLLRSRDLADGRL
jgi:hypothetical protein